MTALADAHIEAQARLRTIVSTAVLAAWTRLPDYDEAQVPAFTVAATGLSVAAQRQSIALTNAYIARMLRRQPVAVAVDRVLASVRLGADPKDIWRRPFVEVWHGIAHGTRFEDAVKAAGARAAGMAETDVQLASRATFAAVERTDERIRGYARRADPGACAYCQAIDGAFVKSADAMPLHPRCGCTLEPLLEERESSPLPADVAVHEHGELGPTIGSAEHDFTRP